MFEIVILGFLFGFSIIYAKLNKFDTISGMATLEDLTVAKTMSFAIGLGIVILNFEIGFGIASFHIKPFILGGVIFGGILFGVGMAILGYCPGTLVISAGEGAVDAVIGLIGGLLGGLAFTVFFPFLRNFLGPNLGKVSLKSLLGRNILFYVLATVIGFGLIILSFYLDRIEKEPKDKKWLYSGIMLGVLNPVIFLKIVQNRPIGASTSFPYLVDKIFGFTINPYFKKIKTAGYWEIIFLVGALLAGFIISTIKREFKFKLIQPRWEKYKGSSKLKRALISFIGGFILIFGARMAGGCTSGHILSGVMQLAVSSFVFGIFVFISLLIAGHIFYKKR